jgi:hypothetical protein
LNYSILGLIFKQKQAFYQEKGVYTEGSFRELIIKNSELKTADDGVGELKIKNSELKTADGGVEALKMPREGVYTEGSFEELKMAHDSVWHFQQRIVRAGDGKDLVWANALFHAL